LVAGNLRPKLARAKILAEARQIRPIKKAPSIEALRKARAKTQSKTTKLNHQAIDANLASNSAAKTKKLTFQQMNAKIRWERSLVLNQLAPAPMMPLKIATINQPPDLLAKNLVCQVVLLPIH
jgi:hypothetical protein